MEDDPIRSKSCTPDRSYKEVGPGLRPDVRGTLDFEKVFQAGDEMNLRPRIHGVSLLKRDFPL